MDFSTGSTPRRTAPSKLREADPARLVWSPLPSSLRANRHLLWPAKRRRIVPVLAAPPKRDGIHVGRTAGITLGGCRGTVPRLTGKGLCHISAPTSTCPSFKAPGGKLQGGTVCHALFQRTEGISAERNENHLRESAMLAWEGFFSLTGNSSQCNARCSYFPSHKLYFRC